MVFIAPENENAENFDDYKIYFSHFSFELSIWQKYALRAIVDKKHVLVTAPTGSGKTLPAEFAIDYFVKNGKKVIYTAPIKALSNQKYFEFKEKYPNISLGILTGDIKDNPDADVLIMTTEILRNNLYQRELVNKQISFPGSLDFNVNIEEDVGAIVFDEVHYINDPERGTVWEECFMMSPANVQFIMLSATIDKPEKFAEWVENIKKQKEVVLTPCSVRAVPLEHHLWISANDSDIKRIQDQKMKAFIQEHINKPILIKKGKEDFLQVSYSKVKKIKTFMEKNKINVKRSAVINNVARYLKKNSLLPAICFIYSRKNVEVYASEITSNLHIDPKNVQIIKKECEKILMKLPNYKEFIQLPEFTFMVKLLEKGVAIHHSGIIPILREMVEILFSKGFIQLLFATETFSVGLNMPTKVVIFTDVNKFDGTGRRYLHSHEYTQQAGRAGRRGFDTKGIVIHLSNLFDAPPAIEYQKILSNTPDRLISRFKMSYGFLLNLIPIYQEEVMNYTASSMIINDISNEIKQQLVVIKDAEKHKLEGDLIINALDTSECIVNEYIEFKKSLEMANNKAKKKILKEIKIIEKTYPNIEKDVITIENHRHLCKHLFTLKDDMNQTKNYISDKINIMRNYLLDYNYLIRIPETNLIGLSTDGMIAANLKEVHSLAFTNNMIKYNNFKDLSFIELAGLFSCFTNITVQDEYKSYEVKSSSAILKEIIDSIQEDYEEFYYFEKKHLLDTGESYDMHFDLISYVMEWSLAKNEIECKNVINKVYHEKGVFLGEFIKSVLKINNIVSELESISEIINDMNLLEKCKKIQENTLKHIVVNQSLYI